NRRFKRVPWNDVARRNFEKKRTAEEWAKIGEGEQKRRKAREEKLKGMGIEYEFEAKVRGAEPAAEEKAKEPVAEEEKKEEKKGKKGGKKGEKAKMIEEAPASAAPAVKVKVGDAVEEKKEKVAVKKTRKAKK